eukprot:TRINITY_DN105629_c0_g1_i1.p1 TRINITY_DN105629_c0_g1~~TRINITY_DN105629_c0_g1_i1.p1  ORF type:complete len:216 (+),score=29.61 TRINITY_DN105629_c0_g1_i1:147-794(+)
MTIKLTYADMRGRVEPARLAFAIGGVAFEDERLSWEEIGKRKAGFPFQQVPVMEEDGKMICQSLAITLYAAQKAKIEPEDPFQRARVCEVLFACEDMICEVVLSIREQDAGKKKEMRSRLAAEFLPKFFQNLENVVAKNCTGGYCVGTSVTAGDLMIANVLSWIQDGSLDDIPAGMCDKYPCLTKVQSTVYGHEKVQNFYKTVKNASTVPSRFKA